jgi:mRNA interferase MazF
VSGPARGEVWWGETVAHGRRPYIVLTRDEAIERLSEVIVVPLTTTVRGLSNEVELNVTDGVPRAYVTSFDNLSTIARGQLVERITTLDPARMDEICRALNATVAC